MDFNVLSTACTPPQCDLKYKTGQTCNKTTEQHSAAGHGRWRKTWNIANHGISQLKVNWRSFWNTSYDHLHSWNACSRSTAAEVACTTALCTNGSLYRCGGNGCTRKHLTQHWVNLNRGFQVRNASKQQHWTSAIFQMLPVSLYAVKRHRQAMQEA